MSVFFIVKFVLALTNLRELLANFAPVCFSFSKWERNSFALIETKNALIRRQYEEENVRSVKRAKKTQTNR